MQLLPTDDGVARFRWSVARRQSADAALGRNNDLGDGRVRFHPNFVCGYAETIRNRLGSARKTGFHDFSWNAT